SRAPARSCGTRELARRLRLIKPAHLSRVSTVGAQSPGGVRDLASLVTRSLKLVLCGLPRAIAAGDCRRPVGRAARDFGERHLPGMTVVQAHDDHAEMQQV